MKTTNYEPIATNVVNRLNEKFASVDVDDLIDLIDGLVETYFLIQNLAYNYEGNDAPRGGKSGNWIKIITKIQ